jgi:hypothetical protein
MKDTNLGGTCNTHDKMRNHTVVRNTKKKKRDELGKFRVDERIILK